jgi:hypothetical protein
MSQMNNNFYTINTVVNTWKYCVVKHLYGYHQYPIEENSCKCALIWWHMENHKFLIVAMLAS